MKKPVLQGEPMATKQLSEPESAVRMRQQSAEPPVQT